MPTSLCPSCNMPMVMKESLVVGICMACRPWFVGVDPAADGDRTSVKCWCGQLTSWRPTDKAPGSCSRCGARFNFQTSKR